MSRESEWENERMRECESARVWEWESVKVREWLLSIDMKTKVVQHVEREWMREWERVRVWEWVWECESVRVRECESERVTFEHRHKNKSCSACPEWVNERVQVLQVFLLTTSNFFKTCLMWQPLIRICRTWYFVRACWRKIHIAGDFVIKMCWVWFLTLTPS